VYKRQARALIPAIKESRNGKLLAVASRNERRALEFASVHNIPVAYGTYEELLRDEEIQAIYIPLPNSLHKEWVIKAAEQGKHVLCEKPLALTAAECYEMDQAARSNNVLLMEAFMYRFHPAFEKLSKLISNGVIGQTRYLHAAFTFVLDDPGNIRFDPQLGGGSLMDVGCYCVNIIRSVMGSEPVKVQAAAEMSKSGVDEHLVGTLLFEDGTLAQFDSGFVSDLRQHFYASGTKGSLDVSNIFLPGTKKILIREKHAAGPEKITKVKGVNEYKLMVEHFNECILQKTALLFPVSEAAANMRVIEALYRSAAEGGRRVEVS
jgi:predicted dehydrogenase